uniref:Uncharacterized protein n=1 Tax=viral metagenome TaxID=1070528 RepID=A0A6C0C3D8_9ZZZZ
MSEKISVNFSKPNLTVVDNSDPGTINIGSSLSGGAKSVNFGPGVEMLMNPNRQKSPSNRPKSDIALSDLQELDSLDLNEGKKSLKETRNNIFNIGGGFDKPGDNTPNKDITSNLSKPNVSFDIKENSTSNLGSNARKAATTATEDGFQTFNEIPINPTANPKQETPLSGKDLLREKFQYLRKLQALEKRGVELSKKYTMEDNLDEMKGEYSFLVKQKEKNNSVKFQGKMLMACVSGLEFLNSKFDPFDLKLDGWAEAVNENIEEYDDVFGELHEKYGEKAKMAPELKLLFMLGGSAAMLHMTNTMFKSAMPGMDDIMRQNPELMQQFTQAAVNTMGDQNPGFQGFMQGVMPQAPASEIPTRPPQGSPPRPPEHFRNNPPKMPKRSARPDVAVGRGADFNDAVNMDNSYENIKTKRVEMKGPSDIGDLLSGLKTKKVKMNEGGGSTISISELNEMHSMDLNSKQPKKSKRRKFSDKNTISLNLN